MSIDSGAAARAPERPSHFDVFFASVWLVFLVSPAIRLWSAEADVGVKVLGWAGLAAFAVAYVLCWLKPTPVAGVRYPTSVWLWFAVLVALGATMVPAIGVGSFSVIPYLIAVLTFQLPLRRGLIAAGLLAAAACLVTWRIDPGALVWVLPMTLISLLIMALIRLTAEHEAREGRMAHDLDLSRQREQLARDVHDLLGHSLTVVAVKVELARKLIDRDPERARAELDDVLALTRGALGEVRATVGRLRSPEWAAQVAAARTALEAAGIEAYLPSDPAVVPMHHQGVFAWCLREAVTNVVRHSGASRCTVTAEPGMLVVTDDGVGVDAVAVRGGAGAAAAPAGSSGSTKPAGASAAPAAADASGASGAMGWGRQTGSGRTESHGEPGVPGATRIFGNGIAGMRERAAERGGTLAVGPAPGSSLTPEAHRTGRPGTRVEVRLP